MHYEVGQKIDIYKVLDHGGYSQGAFIPGTYRHKYQKPGYVNPTLLGKHGVLRGMIENSECRKVGTMIITKLK